MDIAEMLKDNEAKTKDISGQIQRLDQDRQTLLQELLRLDGEHRLLVSLSQES